MKKKLLSFIFLITLLFVCACTKKEEPAPTPTPAPTATPTFSPTPSPSPTPTPTPVPENLALSKLKNLSGFLDFFANYQPENTVDYSEGIGYDLTAELSINELLGQQLGMTELPKLNMTGSFDIKDVLAGNCVFYLDNTELLTTHLFTDYTTLLFNLPKYSSTYAACDLQELVDSSLEEETDWNELEGDSTLNPFGGSSFIRTNTTINSANISTDENIAALLNTYLNRFVECFQPETEITSGHTIGTGIYTMTGEKHTISADAAAIQKVIDTMEADPQTPARLAETLAEINLEEIDHIYLCYYTDGADSYAWELYPDNQPAEPMVFVSTPAGFCFYDKFADGSERINFYSTTTAKGAGTITIPATDPENGDSTIKYLIGEKSISLDINLMGTIQVLIDYSIVNDVVKCNLSITVSGITISTQQTATTEHMDYTVKASLYGLELVTLNIVTDMRDYCEIPVPKDYVDLDTWTAQADLEAFASDLLKVLEDYPLLKDLILNMGENEEDTTAPDAETGTENETPSTGEATPVPDKAEAPDDSYTDAFMGMTGYFIDETGYVDFNPMESEVLALAEPSTGFYRLPVPEVTKANLLNYASQLFADSYEDLYSYYNVSGSTLDNSVYSHFLQCYDYYDNTNYDNSINIAFDAISGEFIWVYCYHDSPAETVRMANDVLELLGTDCILTTDIIDNTELYDIYLIQGKSEEEYYTISILVYLSE